MMDWLLESDIVHLIVDAVAMMNLGEFEAGYKLGRGCERDIHSRVQSGVLHNAKDALPKNTRRSKKV